MYRFDITFVRPRPSTCQSYELQGHKTQKKLCYDIPAEKKSRLEARKKINQRMKLFEDV